jgi:LPS-assembly lipoprotein
MSWSEPAPPPAVIPANAGLQRDTACGSPWIPAFAGMTRLGGLKIIAALTMAAATGGCFQPLYGEAAHPGLVQAMHEVEVTPIPDRIGAYLTDDLIARMNGTGETPKPKYRLKVELSKSVQTPTVESQIQSADAATVTGTVMFALIRIDGEKTIYAGSATSSAVYDRTLQSYSDLRAARDAELRIAKSLADEIELRVAGALSPNP